MKHRIMFSLTMLALSAALLLTADVAAAGDPGSAGLLSLRLGVGAANGAMGETGVAGTTDATAVYWNPANLAYAAGTQLTLQHSEYLGLFRKESFALSHNTEMGSFGVLFSGFYSDELERTSLEPVGVTQGSFKPYDVVMGLAYARAFEQFAVGLTVKSVYERIDLYDGRGLAFDVGLTHRAAIEGLTLAASMQNYGSSFTLDEESFDLPSNLRLGTHYHIDGGGLSGASGIGLAGEIVLPNDGSGRLHTGVEYGIHESFTLRGGYRFNYDTLGATFGAGFVRDALRVDYAFLDSGNDFDVTHRFSLSFATGAESGSVD